MLTTKIEFDTANVEALLTRLLVLKSELQPDDERIGGASADLADAITGLARAVATTGPRHKDGPLPPRVKLLIGSGPRPTHDAFINMCGDNDYSNCPYINAGNSSVECLLAWLIDEATENEE